ncbi:TPA: hypothetical protein EYP27_01435 [Candidatus Bathyarchaeota archaeon]|nr:hypothetical protein [Candidatus Bathyarchaeota archaeon]
MVIQTLGVVKTACGLCHLGCGMNVYLDDGGLVKLKECVNTL